MMVKSKLFAVSAAFLGIEKGFWADEGIDLEMKPGAGIANTQIVGAGVELFCNEGLTDVVESVQAGMEVKAVFAISQRCPMAVISLASNPIRTPKDLEGKTIAAGPGSGTAALLPAVMKATGADYSKVTVRIVDWGALEEMLLLGKVDAIPQYWSDSVADMKGKGIEAHYFTYASQGVSLVGQGMIVSDELIAENPDLIRRFLRAQQKAWLYAMDHQDEAVDAFMKHNPDYDRQVIKEQFIANISLVDNPSTAGKPFGWMAKEDWERTQDLMIDYLGLEQRLPVETYYTNEFVPQ